MKIVRLLGLFLPWMGLRVDGEDTTSLFLQDLITTFGLVSPTIVYNADEEAPEICYTNEWVLCLPHFSNETDKGNNQENTTEKSATEPESRSTTEHESDPKGQNNGMLTLSNNCAAYFPWCVKPYLMKEWMTFGTKILICPVIIVNYPMGSFHMPLQALITLMILT